MPTKTLAPLALLAALACPLVAGTPKHVIVFISDGGGANTHRAYQLWRGSPMVYQSGEWDRYSVSTNALRSGMRPNGPDPLIPDPREVYDPARAWDTTPTDQGAGGYPFHFAGYGWLRATAPDSASTATAIFSGVPAYKGAIDVDGEGNPVRTIAEEAHDRGMAVGVVTSVPFDHATPACGGGAHVPRREMYHEIAGQMLGSGVCDVIAGTGNPFYDDDARRRERPDYTWISEEQWSALAGGTLRAAGDETPWTLVQDTEQIRSLAEGPTPGRFIMIPRVGMTLQERRSPLKKGDDTAPGVRALTEGLPTLSDLTLAALNRVDDDPDGFFLMVEGGAVDWAMHANQFGRMIEEMDDYHQAIEAVCAIIDSGERGYDWGDTLVVITSDHDHLVWGPQSDTIPFQPLTDNGPGETPGHLWLADGHSNQPVPLFVRGAGSERFASIPTKPDLYIKDGEHFERPPYFHQSEIGKTVLGLLGSGETAESGAGAVAR